MYSGRRGIHVTMRHSATLALEQICLLPYIVVKASTCVLCVARHLENLALDMGH
jgi:hypothetical protein